MPLSQKNGQLEGFYATIMGMSRQEAYDKKICIDCKGPAVKFDDPLSVKEYSISCLCQKCQNKAFGRGSK